MIDRDQVLHVARLARLRLTDEELERMPGELSKILEHVEKMDELDLEGVEPTTHVVELENVLREDVPRPCLPREQGARRRARRGRRRLPRAQPGRLVSTTCSGSPRPQQAELIRVRRGLRAPRCSSSGAAARPATTSARTCGSPTSRPREPGALPPVAVKDLFCVEGVPSSAGSRILEGYLPVYTATSVRNLQEAGAAVLGKTNQDEFAMGSSNENSGYGPVQNPWDRTRVPGGSSGGSAAAVAAGTAPWAIGTDTGGSIRQPASLCGVVGLKPTYGAVSRYGMIAFASSLDQCGPLTRDVTDAALMLRALEGRDPCDSTSLGLPEGVTPAERRAPGRPALRRLGARRGGPRPRRGGGRAQRRWTGSRSSAAASRRSTCPAPGTASPPTT